MTFKKRKPEKEKKKLRKRREIMVSKASSVNFSKQPSLIDFLIWESYSFNFSSPILFSRPTMRSSWLSQNSKNSARLPWCVSSAAGSTPPSPGVGPPPPLPSSASGSGAAGSAPGPSAEASHARELVRDRDQPEALQAQQARGPTLQRRP